MNGVRIRRDGQGAIVPVTVRPGSANDRIMGAHDGALKVAVTAAPEKGRANKAVCALIAKALGVKKSAVIIARGKTAQQKEVYIAGETPESLSQRIEEVLK